MNILYGVQGTGNGHISRSREVIRCLKKRGHNVEVIVSGRDPEKLWDMDDFEPYTTHEGLTFITRKGKIDYTRTALKLNLPQFFYDIHRYSKNNLDLVITDFEPISARIARNNKLPSIGLGHQYAFWHDIPVTSGNIIARLILKKYAPVKIPVGLHWHHFNQPILPPIIPQDFHHISQLKPNKVLIYLPFEELEDVLKLVKEFTKYEFYIYHSISIMEDIGHLHLRPFSRQGFINDLEECSSVICSAGFELVSEALAIGKKILVKPLGGQMEQYSNALVLKHLKLGMVMETMNQKTVGDFLESDHVIKVTYPDVALIITHWLERGQWHDVNSLADECWSRTA